MAYDEYGASSNKAGTTAGYDWVELGIKKFIETEEIKEEIGRFLKEKLNLIMSELNHMLYIHI